MINAQTVKEFIEKVKASGNKDVTLYMYPGEGHGFMNGGDDIHKMMKSELYSLQHCSTACMTDVSYVLIGQKAITVCCSCKKWQAVWNHDAHACFMLQWLCGNSSAAK